MSPFDECLDSAAAASCGALLFIYLSVDAFMPPMQRERYMYMQRLHAQKSSVLRQKSAPGMPLVRPSAHCFAAAGSLLMPRRNPIRKATHQNTTPDQSTLMPNDDYDEATIVVSAFDHHSSCL